MCENIDYFLSDNRSLGNCHLYHPYKLVRLAFANAFDYSGELYVGNGTEILRGVLSSSASGNQSEGAIPWGQISLIMLTFGLFYQKIDNKILKNSFIILAVLNCFLSTKRSVIVPMLLLLGCIFVNKGILQERI